MREPFGLSLETKAAFTFGQNLARQIMGGKGWGWMSVATQKPPMPVPQASAAPRVAGAVGTRAWSGAGCAATIRARHSQSAKADFTVPDRRSRGVFWHKVCCRMEKRYLLPCKAGTMLRSSPNRANHFALLTLDCVSSGLINSSRRACRWGGR